MDRKGTSLMTDKLSPMQDELLKRADSIFGSIAEAVGQAKDLAVEQLPDIAYQYIAYNRMYITFVVLSALLVWVAFQIFMIKLNNKQCEFNHYDKGRWNENQGMPYIIGTAITSLICGVAFFYHIKDFFMVWFAPKIFIIEHIVQLVRH